MQASTLEDAKKQRSKLMQMTFDEHVNQGLAVEINGGSYRFAGQKVIDDLSMALKFAQIKGLTELSIKDSDGKMVVVSVTQLQDVLNQCVEFGVETWTHVQIKTSEIEACTAIEAVYQITW